MGVPPVSIPAGQPVVLKFNLDKITFSSVDMSAFVRGAPVKDAIADTTTASNRSNTEKLKSELSGKEKELAQLFESELRRRFVAKGGKIQSGPESRAVTISIDHLGVGYHAKSFASTYAPIAYVYVHATTDPPSVGDRPGATIRSIDTRVDDSAYSFFSAKSFLEDSDKGYAGLKAAVTALAEKVAITLRTAQGAGGL